MIERLWLPYCGAAPGPGEWLGRWNLDPWLIGALALCGLLTSLRSGLWDRDNGPRRRVAAQAALAVFALFNLSPLCALSSAFFTVRVVHHMVLVLLVAPLLAFALAPWIRRLTRHVWLWTAGAAAIFWLWHAPGAYSAALSSDPLYWAMQLSLLASAAGFWAAVRQAGGGTAIAAILATTVQMGLLGALITFSVRTLYPPHLASTLAWNISPLSDQQLAGLLMWAPGSFLYLLAALMIGRAWLHGGTPARALQP